MLTIARFLLSCFWICTASLLTNTEARSGQGKAWGKDTVASLYLTTISIKSLRNRV